MAGWLGLLGVMPRALQKHGILPPAFISVLIKSLMYCEGIL
jgi:hypothetical protein